jgi:2-octaprenyl-6-methoxyphenol hydroxylase
LRQALGPRFAVTLVDPELVRGAVAAEAEAILDMVITDSRVEDAVRPVFLTFAGEIEPGEPFAHMVENARLVGELAAKAAAAGVTLVPQPVKAFVATRAGVTITLGDDTTWAAKLLVAADGGRSRLRGQAGIAVRGWSYGQSAIVTTVAHEREHHGRAEEHFLPGGPFAILPLRHNRSSIVWTELTAEAERIVALPDREFHRELEKRFGLHLGDIAVVGPRRAYPVGLWVAQSFIAERMALVGDAAHVIHPIAGQGLNMGLRDIAALAEAIVDAARLGLDPGDATVLERYQRWRRFDTMSMSVSTDMLNRLFSNRSDVLRLVRDIGLGLVDRLPPLKRMFIREAAGLTGEVPKLLRGEAL